MVRNLVVIGGNSHDELTNRICTLLNVPPCNRLLGKFSSGESRCEIYDSVRGKDVYIVQTGSDGSSTISTSDGGSSQRLDNVNDHLMELCIMISACKIGSAKRITAVLPMFPYSRQPDIPYNKQGAPLARHPYRAKSGGGSGGGASGTVGDATPRMDYTFESVPPTPGPGASHTAAVGIEGLTWRLSRASTMERRYANGAGVNGDANNGTLSRPNDAGHAQEKDGADRANSAGDTNGTSDLAEFHSNPGYKQWIAQPGTLIAGLLECAGANHIVTMDLHTSVYQGFFDVPVDNLYGKPLLERYIRSNIPNYRDAVIVSPDAGGAKRATDIADSLNMEFALIHKERRPIKYADPPETRTPAAAPVATPSATSKNPTMMLVGNIRNRVCVIVDDMVDTANTITRAAKLLKREGATTVYVLLTHGVFSGDAIPRINMSALDRVVVTNTVPQDEHQRLCPKLEVLDVSSLFSEAIRRAHHGESLSVLFQYN